MRNSIILGSCKCALDHRVGEIITADSELTGALKGIAQVLGERGIKFKRVSVPKTHTFKQQTQR